MSLYRTAICGLSPIAARRPPTTVFGRVAVSHAAAYAADPRIDVVAVCDRLGGLVDACREAWADTWPAAAGYRDAVVMLGEARPEIVSVATPDDTHAEIFCAAVEAGASGILCEKPLATSLADADAMLAAAESRGVAVVVAHTRRYLPLYHLARDAVRSGAIGEPLLLRCLQAGPRAMLFRNGTHAVDLLTFLAGAPPVEVWGRLEAGYEGYDRYRGDGGHDPASEPTAAARIVYANGRVAEYQGLRLQAPLPLTFEIVGALGTVVVNDRRATVIRGDEQRELVPPPYDSVGLAAAVVDLLRQIETGDPPISSGEHGREAVAVIEAILQSAANGGGPVRVAGRKR